MAKMTKTWAGGNVKMSFEFDEAALLRLGEEKGDAVSLEFAKEVAQVARELVPVDEGDLLRSIDVRDAPPGVQGYVVGTDTGHGAHTELGLTGQRKGKDGKYHRQKAQPFLRPAQDVADSRFDEIAARVKD